MRNLFPKTFLVTGIAVGALWAGTLHADVADFVQVNLVSDIPGLATITELPGQTEIRRAPSARRRPFPSGNGREPRCLHPMQSVCARMP